MALSQKVLSGPSETSATTSGNCKLMYEVIAEIINGSRGVGDAHSSNKVQDNITSARAKGHYYKSVIKEETYAVIDQKSTKQSLVGT
mgnify:CR=1 FL=1